VFCLGVLIVSAITLATINDIFLYSESASNEGRYRGVAGWLLFVGIAGLIVQAITSVLQGLYHGKIISTCFVAFTIAVSCNALADIS